MQVLVHLYTQSEPIVRSNVRNTYVKSGMFCVMREDFSVEKYPVEHIFRVTETSQEG